MSTKSDSDRAAKRQHSGDAHAQPTSSDCSLGEPTTQDIIELLPTLAPPEGPGEIGRLGGYRVIKVLGAGGMGVVYQAEDPQLKRPVALKVMKPVLAANEAAAARFIREAQAMAAL